MDIDIDIDIDIYFTRGPTVSAFHMCTSILKLNGIK